MSKKSSRILISLFFLAILGACSTIQSTRDDPENPDPLEGMNRAVFAFNEVADRAIIDPVANTYNKLPETPRKIVRNFFRNLREPWVFINDILQGEFDRASDTIGRFFINTTLGLGGTLNMAPKAGLTYHNEDFGQTLAVWGVREGPYLVLPFFGPSTVRDSFALTAVDMQLNPVGIAERGMDEKGLQLGHTAAEVLSLRAGLDAQIDGLYETSDPYTFARTAYLQSRRHSVRNGKREDIEEDDLFGDFEDEEAQNH